MTSGSDQTLLRTIGTWSLAASIVNITIGGGIFRLPGSPQIAGVLGANAVFAYLICATVMACIVVCIAQAGRRVTLTGGPYAYVEAQFGPFAGYVIGVLLWLVGATAIPGVAGLFGDAAGKILPALATPSGRAFVLAVIFAAVSIVNVRGVKYGMGLNVVFTVAKVAPLLLLLVVGMFFVQPGNLAPTHLPGVREVLRASVYLIFIFAGVESALVPSGEVRDTNRTLPRALMIAFVVITALYAGLQIVAQGILGPALTGDQAPLASAASRVFGPWGASMIGTGLMISAFGFLSGMMLATPRTLFAFGRDGFLPRQFAAIHPTFRTPWMAIIAQALLSWILAITNSFERLAIIANVSASLIYLACAAAAFKINPRSIVAPVAAAGVITLLTAVQFAEWKILAIVLAVAVALYAVARTRNQGQRIAAVEA